MRPDRTQSDSFHRWDNLVTAVAANAADLPHLETSRQKLDTMLTEVRDLSARQAVLTASKQDLSKRIAELVRSGRKVAPSSRRESGSTTAPRPRSWRNSGSNPSAAAK